MRLIGMLDSPYVRRVAIALRLLEIPFEHDPLSVFSTFDQFSRVNPVVKAPTLVCDDGIVLMDSGLIIDHLETRAGRSLWPADLASRTRALRVTGLALAACEKVMQIYYEHNLRPAAHGLAAAIAWRFMQIKLVTPVADAACPALAAFSARAEALPAFLATPADDSVNVSTPGYRTP